MRKITQNSVNAFLVGRNFSSENMTVKVNEKDNSVELYLHGNCIAKREINSSKVYVNDCGWQSNTTKERLNGILDAYGFPRIYQKAFQWFWMDGKPFYSSSWQAIN